MIKLFLPFLMAFVLTSCDKENSDRVSGTVKAQSGCFQDSWLVAIDRPNSSDHPFICNETLAGAAYNCSNAVYITNLPERFAKQEKKIEFSVVTDQGIACLSYSFGPHHLEVKNVSEVR